MNFDSRTIISIAVVAACIIIVGVAVYRSRKGGEDDQGE